jgi:hypothetical protein
MSTLIPCPQAYLKARTIFDEFSSWTHLPAALEGFLADMGRHHEIQLLPLHFVLQDSQQAYVVGVTGGMGVLFG